MAIRETDVMLVCLEATKNIVKDYNQEVNDALHRISMAFYEAGRENVVIERAEDNPVERGIVVRCTRGTIGLVLGLEGGV